MRILFAGTPEIAAETLQALIDSTHEVVGVLTQPDARGKRGKALIASPVATLAENAGIEVLKPEKARSAESIEWIRSLDAEVAIVVAYGQLLSREVLDTVPHGFFNVHYSLLPEFRGAAPIQRAIEAGKESTGITVFQLDEGLDTGPIAVSIPAPIQPLDTSGTLMARLATEGARLAVEVLDSLEQGTLTLTEQRDEGASYAKKMLPAQGEINPLHSAKEVSAHLRAFIPNPGAYFSLDGLRIKVSELGDLHPAELPTLRPGELHAHKKGLFMGTATDAIHIVRLAPAGKKEMAAADWARGAHLEQGVTIDQAAMTADQASETENDGEAQQ